MNLLLKQELIAECNDEELLRKFFDHIYFLDRIKNKSEISEEEKKTIDEIIDSLMETTLATAYLFLNDFYAKRVYKIISVFLIQISSKFSDINKEYSDMLKAYSKRLDEIRYALDSLDKLNIDDIKLLYELNFLTFITSINDLAIFDYNMLNINKYSDSNLQNLSYVKSSARSYELSLITLNRKLKKENS